MDKNTQKKIISFFSWAMIERIGAVGIQFACNVFLARQLTPDDYGVFGLMSIFINFGNILVDSGMGGNLIAKKKIEKIDYSTLFIFNIVASIVIFALIYAISPIVATYYKTSSLCILLRVFALSIIINGFGNVQYIRLIKELRTKEMCICTITASLIASVIAIIFANKGMGAWSLVVYYLVLAIINTSLYYCIIKERPLFRFQRASFYEHYHYGINLLGGNILYILKTNFYSLVIGKSFSVKTLGFYTQNMKLYTISMSTFAAIVDRTLFPLLSKKEEKDIFDQTSKLINAFLVLALPLAITISFASKQIIGVVFGSQWRDSGWLFSIIVLAVIPFSIKTFLRNMLKTLGYTKEVFTTELYSTIIAIILIGALFKTSIGIITGVFLVDQIATAVIIYILTTKKCPNYSTNISGIKNPIIVSAVIVLVLTGCLQFLNGRVSDLLFIIIMFAAASLTCLAMYSFLQDKYFLEAVHMLQKNIEPKH